MHSSSSPPPPPPPPQPTTDTARSQQHRNSKVHVPLVERFELDPWQRWVRYKAFPRTFLLHLILLVVASTQALFLAQTTSGFSQNAHYNFVQWFLPTAYVVNLAGNPLTYPGDVIFLHSIAELNATLFTIFTSYFALQEQQVTGGGVLVPTTSSLSSSSSSSARNSTSTTNTSRKYSESSHQNLLEQAGVDDDDASSGAPSSSTTPFGTLGVQELVQIFQAGTGSSLRPPSLSFSLSYSGEYHSSNPFSQYHQQKQQFGGYQYQYHDVEKESSSSADSTKKNDHGPVVVHHHDNLEDAFPLQETVLFQSLNDYLSWSATAFPTQTELSHFAHSLLSLNAHMQLRLYNLDAVGLTAGVCTLWDIGIVFDMSARGVMAVSIDDDFDSCGNGGWEGLPFSGGGGGGGGGGSSSSSKEGFAVSPLLVTSVFLLVSAAMQQLLTIRECLRTGRLMQWAADIGEAVRYEIRMERRHEYKLQKKQRKLMLLQQQQQRAQNSRSSEGKRNGIDRTSEEEDKKVSLSSSSSSSTPIFLSTSSPTIETDITNQRDNDNNYNTTSAPNYNNFIKNEGKQIPRVRVGIWPLVREILVMGVCCGFCAAPLTEAEDDMTDDFWDIDAAVAFTAARFTGDNETDSSPKFSPPSRTTTNTAITLKPSNAPILEEAEEEVEGAAGAGAEAAAANDQTNAAIAIAGTPLVPRTPSNSSSTADNTNSATSSRLALLPASTGDRGGGARGRSALSSATSDTSSLSATATTTTPFSPLFPLPPLPMMTPLTTSGAASSRFLGSRNSAMNNGSASVSSSSLSTSSSAGYPSPAIPALPPMTYASSITTTSRSLPRRNTPITIMYMNSTSTSSGRNNYPVAKNTSKDLMNQSSSPPPPAPFNNINNKKNTASYASSSVSPLAASSFTSASLQTIPVSGRTSPAVVPAAYPGENYRLMSLAQASAVSQLHLQQQTSSHPYHHQDATGILKMASRASASSSTSTSSSTTTSATLRHLSSSSSSTLLQRPRSSSSGSLHEGREWLLPVDNHHHVTRADSGSRGVVTTATTSPAPENLPPFQPQPPRILNQRQFSNSLAKSSIATSGRQFLSRQPSPSSFLRPLSEEAQEEEEMQQEKTLASSSSSSSLLLPPSPLELPFLPSTPAASFQQRYHQLPSSAFTSKSNSTVHSSSSLYRLDAAYLRMQSAAKPVTHIHVIELFSPWLVISFLGECFNLTYAVWCISSGEVNTPDNVNMLLAIGAAFEWAAFAKYARHHGTLSIFERAFRKSLPSIGRNMLATVPIFFAFSTLATMMFGNLTERFDGLPWASIALFAVSNGDVVRETFQVTLQYQVGAILRLFSQGIMYVYVISFTYVMLKTTTAISEEAFLLTRPTPLGYVHDDDEVEEGEEGEEGEEEEEEGGTATKDADGDDDGFSQTSSQKKEKEKKQTKTKKNSNDAHEDQARPHGDLDPEWGYTLQPEIRTLLLSMQEVYDAGGYVSRFARQSVAAIPHHSKIWNMFYGGDDDDGDENDEGNETERGDAAVFVDSSGVGDGATGEGNVATSSSSTFFARPPWPPRPSHLLEDSILWMRYSLLFTLGVSEDEEKDVMG